MRPALGKAIDKVTVRVGLAVAALALVLWALPAGRAGEDGGHHADHPAHLDAFEKAGVTEFKAGQRGPGFRARDQLRLQEALETDASVLSALTVPGVGSSLVKLANVADLGQGMSPGQIERYPQERSITVISNLLPSKPLAEAFREA